MIDVFKGRESFDYLDMGLELLEFGSRYRERDSIDGEAGSSVGGVVLYVVDPEAELPAYRYEVLEILRLPEFKVYLEVARSVLEVSFKRGKECDDGQ